MNASFKWDIDGAMAWSEAKIDRGLRALTLDGAALIQNAMRESPRGGRQYGRHTASAPGEAPAPDTGRLLGAVFGGQTFKVPDAVVGRIAVNTEYAAHLELGTEKMAPRPFIVSTVRENWEGRLMPIFTAMARRG